MINRRLFIKASAGAALGGLIVTSGCNGGSNGGTTAADSTAAAATGQNRLERIGVQLYTVRSLLGEDFEGTLRQVAGVGFNEFEFAGLYDRSPEQVKALLDELGVAAPSAHVGMNLVRDNLDSVIAEANTMGYQYIVVPSLPEELRSSIEAYRQTAGMLNTAGERLRAEGKRIAYHNHAFEFEETDGQIPYNVLLEETDPNLVDMELDLYWMKAGGHDPLAYFEQYPGRFALCHVKDTTETGEMAAVGEGTTDFAAIFSQSEQAGLKHYVVEHDNPTDAMQSITTSYQYLNGLTY